MNSTNQPQKEVANNEERATGCCRLTKNGKTRCRTTRTEAECYEYADHIEADDVYWEPNCNC